MFFDGSSSVGMSRALVREGSWQVGVQPPPISNAGHPGVRTVPAILGRWQTHAFVFKPSESGSEASHFIEGQKVAAVRLKSPAVLAGLMFGANAAATDHLVVDLAEAAVFNAALDAAELEKWSEELRSRWGQPQDAATQEFGPVPGPDPAVFHTVLRRRGDDGVSCYRIPGLATSTNGTLLAVFDIRHDNCSDLPGNIDVGLMRSTDDGTTWSPMTTIMDFDSTVPGSRGNGVGDPCILVDHVTGAIIVAALWSKGGRGWHDSGPGMSPEETGQFVLVRSMDDGMTWSEPINITSQVKKPDWRLCFQGPGAGIQLRDGTLVLPAQFKGTDNKAHAFFIFSKDGGQSWTRSGAIEGPNVPETTEAQVAELSDGAILITLRNHAGKGLRAWSRWNWTGDLANGSWSPLEYACEDPVCQASLVRANDGTLIFANPASSTRRVAMSLRFSRDDGETWSSPRLLDPRPSSYSSMTVLRDGSIGILYECGDANPVENLAFARIPADWILRRDRKAGLKPAPVFGDNMVLQRDMPLPVWGTAEPNTSVEVSFADRVSRTTADQNGCWKVSLNPLPSSSRPQILHVAAESPGGAWETLQFTNVLIGEVWIAAGQSNMEWPLKRDEFAAETLAAAQQPGLRLLNLDFVSKYGFGTAFTHQQLASMKPGSFFNGRWNETSPDTAKPFSAIGFYFGWKLHQELNVPVGIIHLAVGGSPTEAWIRRHAMEGHNSLLPLVSGNWLTNELLGAWCRERGTQNLGQHLVRGDDVPGDDLGPNHPFKPGFLWQAGLEPLAPFAMRGVIWYQGESNAQEPGRVRQHEMLFKLLVDDWRDQWKQGAFPFLFCQISSIGTERGYQAQYWPHFRDSQRRMLASIENSAMVVTSDLGDPVDVHPRNKRDVGHRLALAALGMVYQRDNVTSGPLFAAARHIEREVWISFSYAEGLQTTDGAAPNGFEVAGVDQVFHPVTARIQSDSVVLNCDGITAPAQVRYGWMPFPKPPLNLCNAAGLPASTFAGQITAGRIAVRNH
jgi:hypothetical protein